MTDDGRMTNSSLLDYRMPTSLDLPMIETIIVGWLHKIEIFIVSNLVNPQISNFKDCLDLVFFVLNF